MISGSNAVLKPPGRSRRIVLANVAGFCFGVRRAVDMAYSARAAKTGRLTSLGPIIHNEQVIERMRGAGIETAAELGDVRDGTIILSAHGTAPQTLRQAKAQGLGVLDVTCPFVTKVHNSAKKLWEQGYQILLVGDRGHTEVKGVLGALEALGGSAVVVSSPEEVAGLELGKKVGILSQTTQRGETFGRIVAEVSRQAAEVRVFNTICGATDELQDAARRLAHETDVVIVVGGRKSANTRRLRDIVEESGTPAYHIETPDEIDEAWLRGRDVVGLTAGASTPDWLIEDVARALNEGELPPDWRVHHPDEC